MFNDAISIQINPPIEINLAPLPSSDEQPRTAHELYLAAVVEKLRQKGKKNWKKFLNISLYF